MILKKPYAFLIKHFKLIHLILAGIYVYLAFKVNSILSYYNNFTSGTVGKLNAINYINSFYLIAIILSIVICTIILILMHHKKKPKLLYIILIILYILIAGVISLSMNGLNTIYFSVLDAKTLRLYRDLLRIILIVQYITIAITLVRGLGFDIKKFDFVKDLNEMNIDVSDDEEIELTLNGTNVITRNIRRRIRELKYYYIENKTFINIIIIIVIVIGLFTLTINTQVINKVYSERETFTTDDFHFQVLNTYITNKSSSNKTISTNNSSFIIIKMQVSPNTEEPEINTSNLILKIDNNSYTINNRYYNSFLDIGNAYRNQKINTTRTYLFIYNIPNEDITKKMQLIYGSDKKINLNPINLDETEDTINLSITNTLDLSSTILSSGTITINSYEVAKEFPYEYTYEIEGTAHTGTLQLSSTTNTILKLDITSSLPNNLTLYDLISTYGKIKYTIDNTEYTNNLTINKTPGSYQNGLYLEVDKEIEQAENIYLEINIRNKKYNYKIK